jgi:hypothetical protein
VPLGTPERVVSQGVLKILEGKVFESGIAEQMRVSIGEPSVTQGLIHRLSVHEYSKRQDVVMFTHNPNAGRLSIVEDRRASVRSPSVRQSLLVDGSGDGG